MILFSMQTMIFTTKGLPDLHYSEELSKEDYKKWDIAHENCFHTIYNSGDKVVIELKQEQ